MSSFAIDKKSGDRADAVDLRAEVAKLRRELTIASKAKPPIRRKLMPLIHRLDAIRNSTLAALGGVHGDLVRTLNELESPLDGYFPTGPLPRGPTNRLPKRPSARSVGSDTSLPEGERAVLMAIAQNEDGADTAEITILTGYKGSTRDAYASRLRSRDYIEKSGNRFRATADGIAALGDNFEPLPQGADLRAHWVNRLPEGERKIFVLLTEAYPNGMTRPSIDGATSFKRSTRDAYISRLVARKLVVATRSEVTASNRLF